jgi:hypothetical protein
MHAREGRRLRLCYCREWGAVSGRAHPPCKPSAINLGDDRWRCGGRGYRALQRHTHRAVSPSPLARMCRRRGAIPPQRAILSHPLRVSSAFDRPGLCDVAAGEAETCLGKLTTLRSYRACPRAIERHQNSTKRMGGNVTRPRAADDFAAIRARMEELRREREGAQAAESDLQQDPPMHRARTARWQPSEMDAGPGRVRQSGSGRG